MNVYVSPVYLQLVIYLYLCGKQTPAAAKRRRVFTANGWIAYLDSTLRFLTGDITLSFVFFDIFSFIFKYLSK